MQTASSDETGEHEDCAISMTRRRSKLSAMAPEASEKIMIGSEVDAWTSATMSSEAAIEVISQAAPTDWIRPPRLEARLASHTARNTGWVIGASGDARSFNKSPPPGRGLLSSVQ